MTERVKGYSYVNKRGKRVHVKPHLRDGAAKSVKAKPTSPTQADSAAQSPSAPVDLDVAVERAKKALDQHINKMRIRGRSMTREQAVIENARRNELEDALRAARAAARKRRRK